MDWETLETNSQHFGTLQGHLQSTDSVMLTRGKNEMYIFRPSYQGLLTVQQVATKELLLPPPLADPETNIFDGQIVEESLKQIPHSNVYNPLHYDMEVVEHVESKIKSLKGFCEKRKNKTGSDEKENYVTVNRPGASAIQGKVTNGKKTAGRGRGRM